MDYTEALDIFKQASAKLGKPFVECPDQGECLQKLILWAIRSPQYPGRLNAGIMLRGRRDTGKTHAFRCLQKVLEVFTGNTGGGFNSSSNFNVKVCQDIVSDYNSQGEEALDLRSDHYFATLFDDLGEEREGNFMGKPCNVMAEVIQGRYRRMQSHRLVTMFTTNLATDKDITDRYGERVTTRLYEMCDFILWKGPAEGYRKKVDPLPWNWEIAVPKAPPPTPEQIAERKAKSDAAIEQTRKVLDERERADRERAEVIRMVKVNEALAELPRLSLGQLSITARFSQHREVKEAAKAEIAKRTSATLEEVHAATDRVDRPSAASA